MQARREELECQLRARRDEAEEAEHRTAQRRQEDQSRLEAAEKRLEEQERVLEDRRSQASRAEEEAGRNFYDRSCKIATILKVSALADRHKRF